MIACLKGILWMYGLSSFHGRDTQIRSMFGQKSTYSLRKCLYFALAYKRHKSYFKKSLVISTENDFIFVPVFFEK